MLKVSLVVLYILCKSNMYIVDGLQEEGQPVDPHLLLHGSGDGGQDEGYEGRTNT